jgi:hypothetical protein
VTVSREVPIICAISSCVSASLAAPRAYSNRRFSNSTPAGIWPASRLPSTTIPKSIPRGVVLLAELFGHFEAGIAVFLQETEKVFALDEIHLARINALSCQLLSIAGNRGVQAQYFPRLGNL